MLYDMKIWQKMQSTDLLQMDGAYKFIIPKIVEEAEKLGIALSDDNFCTPIRKIVRVNMQASELIYNDSFGGHRSGIEFYFARLSNTFKRFGPKARTTVNDLSIFNLQ